MNYEQTDPSLDAWAAKHRLTIYTEFRDDEVRFSVVKDDLGRSFQIFLRRPPDELGNLEVVTTDNAGRSATFSAHLTNLPQALDLAYEKTLEWISADGRTRSNE
ncbi:MAG: hypothetical protein KDD64_04130 [Bdellovibrionales bacterium]|nr:hypothetical protein [Bdellovibrionales bacterium]